MDYRLPGSSVCGISQARIQEWVAISSFRGSWRPRNPTTSLALASRFLLLSHLGSQRAPRSRTKWQTFISRREWEQGSYPRWKVAGLLPGYLPLGVYQADHLPSANQPVPDGLGLRFYFWESWNCNLVKVSVWWPGAWRKWLYFMSIACSLKFKEGNGQ